MKSKINIQLTRSIVVIFWLGFFMAISFMEAPLKFTAPHVSMAEGLQIGKLVFGMLNVCEWGFLVVIAVTCLIKKPKIGEGRLIAAAALVLALETFWLLPLLGHNADKIINGQVVAEHGLHWVYVALELIKVPVLLFTGISGLRSVLKPASSYISHN